VNSSTLFRYRAVALAGPSKGTVALGELSGETPAEVRARLRAGGLQVLELAPLRGLALPKLGVAAGVSGALTRYLRSRRRAVKEEVLDGLATLLDAGVPLVEAVDTMIHGEAVKHATLRRMLIAVRDDVRSGNLLAAALREHEGWFDPVEIALLEAGEHGGTLAGTLRSLAARQTRRGEVGQKIASALAYPTIVAVIGVAVWIFLSTKTLPQLVKILEDARIETPALTRAVMTAGGFMARDGIWVVLGGALLGTAVNLVASRHRPTRRRRVAARSSHFGLTALRRLSLARVTESLAELLLGGVPLVEGLRAVAPTAGSRALRIAIDSSAASIEQGERFSETLIDESWFPPEFRRLVEMGETSGELAPLLERLGQRMERSAERRIAQLASLLEPAAILTLAVLIGVVVAAAILPITRLQNLV
jgi:type II secretory pathway component PulF